MVVWHIKVSLFFFHPHYACPRCDEILVAYALISVGVFLALALDEISHSFITRFTTGATGTEMLGDPQQSLSNKTQEWSAKTPWKSSFSDIRNDHDHSHEHEHNHVHGQSVIAGLDVDCDCAQTSSVIDVECMHKTEDLIPRTAQISPVDIASQEAAKALVQVILNSSFSTFFCTLVICISLCRVWF
jgi:hypothetical protein